MSKYDRESVQNLSEQILMTTVQREYDLTVSGPFKLFKGGIESAAWHVQTLQGDWVAKVFSPHEGPLIRVAGEGDLCNFLRAHGINAPEVQPTVEQSLIGTVQVQGNRLPLLLMKYEKLVRTYPTTITKDQMTQIARTLAHMHSVLQNYPGRFDLKPKDIATSHDKIYGPTFPTVMESPNAAVYRPDEIGYFADIDQRMVAHANGFIRSSTLTKSALHNDVKLEHTPFLSNGDVYIYDFSDRLWPGSVAQELANMLTYMFREEDMPFDRWEDLKTWLLQGYESVSPLNKEDYKAIGPGIIRKCLDDIGYKTDVAVKTGKEIDPYGNRRLYRLADYLLQRS